MDKMIDGKLYSMVLNADPETGQPLRAVTGLKIEARGVTITTGATSASVAIPNTSAGIAPFAVRLATTASCYARLGRPLEASVVDAAAGAGYLVGDLLTVVGGVFSVPMVLGVATTKLLSCLGNAIGLGYNIGDVITLSGGTASTPATLTISHLQLAAGTSGAAGTDYSSGNVITTASAGSTASTHATVNVDTVKAITAAVDAHGLDYAAGDVLTDAAGTATFNVATLDVAVAPTVTDPGTGYVAGVSVVTLAVTGSTSSVKATATVSTTKVVSAVTQAGGTGDLGAGAGVIVEGTTGTGTKFRASVTIGATNDIVSVESVTDAGSYTIEPTSISAEPVIYISGASSGTTLTGAALTVVMGALTMSLTTPGTYTVGGAVATQDSATGGGTGATFAGISFGVKSVTVASGGSYSGVNPASMTTTVSPAGGSGCTLNTLVFGVNTWSIVNHGDYTVKGTDLSQNGATTPAGGTGWTATAPSWGPLAWTYSNAGNYTATSTTLTQAATPAPASGGSGATFNAASYGVLTANVVDPGSYTVDPTNPVATTGGGDGNATFNVTMVIPAVVGDLLVTPYESVIVTAVGFDHVAALQETTAGVLQISPVEN